MPSRSEKQNRSRVRVSNACSRCRKHKIKCSGSRPCAICEHRGARCEFDSSDKKVAISESALRDLRDRISRYESVPSRLHHQQLPMGNTESETIAIDGSPLGDNVRFNQSNNRNSQPLMQEVLEADDDYYDATSSREDSAAITSSDLTNPLVTKQASFVLDNHGRLRYLGHSSTWSFSQQLLHLTHQTSHTMPTANVEVNSEASVYTVKATLMALRDDESATLPSHELSLLYMQSVKSRTQPLYYLFDEEHFMPNFHRLYDGVLDLRNERLWYVHYLLIMAFGKTLNAQTACCLAGQDLFDRALSLLPDVTVLCQEPVHSTEILCCIALYLQSIDHRAAAHVYVGQALRMSQTHGLYTDMQESSIGAPLVTRCRRLWWTVYTLDRRLGSSFGVPSGIRDRDMTTPFPTASNPSNTSAIGQTLNVKICQLLGKVISTVYSKTDKLNDTFISTTREVLRGIAPLAEEIIQFDKRCVGEISRVTANLNLAYHQCIMLASRPLLFHLLQKRVDRTSSDQNFRLSSSMKGLVQVGVDSAVQATMILSRLKQHDIIDCFIPFDLETVFSAALVLVIASGVHPKLLPPEDWLNSCYLIFDYMTIKGNALAALRKSEVQQLAHIRQHLAAGRSGQHNLGADIRAAAAAMAQQVTPTASDHDYASLPSLGDPFFEEWIADDGISGAQILDLADALDFQDIML